VPLPAKKFEGRFAVKVPGTHLTTHLNRSGKCNQTGGDIDFRSSPHPPLPLSMMAQTEEATLDEIHLRPRAEKVLEQRSNTTGTVPEPLPTTSPSGIVAVAVLEPPQKRIGPSEGESIMLVFASPKMSHPPFRIGD